MKMSLPLAVFILIALTSLSACDPIAEIKSRLGVIADKGLPQNVKDEMNTAEQQVDKASTASELAKEHGELLSEMERVVFDQENVEDKSDFGGLAHSLNEGASLEGIYRGLVMGSRYRSLESKSQSASPVELKVFAAELLAVQKEMEHPTHFTPGEAKKIPSIDFPDGTEADHVEEKTPEQEANAKDASEFLQMFIGASSFTLKRVLGDELLKKMDETKDAGLFSQWYAKWVVHMSESKVDFGLELRNKPDFDLHFKFAQKMARDRVKWEVLNRVHRVLNVAAKQK